MNADGLPSPRRAWAALALGMAIMMAVLDSSIANVALPTIASDFGASPARSVWVVNAYQLAVVVTLLPLAALGDIIGYRRVFIGGLVAFILSSLGCALAPGLVSLTVARAVQGASGAAIMAVMAALLRHTYPQSMLGRGISRNAVWVGMSAALGPTVAAAILSVGDWPWLFAVNVPLGLATLTVAWLSLPSTPASPRRFDWISAILNALTFGPLILGLEGLAQGEGRPFALAGLAVSAVCGVLIVRRSLARPHPLVPVDLLRIPILALSIVASICAFCASMMAFVAMPFVLQYGYGRSAEATGLLMTAWPLSLAVLTPLAGRLADRRQAGLLGGLGLAATAAGLVLLALLPAKAAAIDVVWRLALCGAGYAFFQSPNNRTIITSAPRERSGAAGGLLSTARLVGFSLGACLVALMFHLYPGDHRPLRPLLVAAGFAAAAAAASLARVKGKPAAT